MKRSTTRTSRWLRAAVVAVTAAGLAATGIVAASAESNIVDYGADWVSVNVQEGDGTAQVRVQADRDAQVVFLTVPPGTGMTAKAPGGTAGVSFQAVSAGTTSGNAHGAGYRFWSDKGNLRGSTIWMTLVVPKNTQTGRAFSGDVLHFSSGKVVKKDYFGVHVQEPTPDAFSSAEAGRTTGSMVITQPDITSNGTMTITAPPGTTFASVSRPFDQGSVRISADKKTATIANTHFGTSIYRVSVEIAVPSDARPGQELIGMFDIKDPDKKNILITDGRYVVHVTGTVPSQVATAPPGETTPNIVLNPPYRIVGTAILTAPPGTTFHSVTSDRGSAVLSDDRTKANTGGADFGGGAPALRASLNIPAGAKPGTHFPGGTVEIKDTSDPRGFVLAAGSFDAAAGQRGATLTSPQPGSTIAPETVFTGSGPVGDVVVISNSDGVEAGKATVGADGNWSTKLTAMGNGTHRLRVTITGGSTGEVLVAEGDYVMEGSFQIIEIPAGSGSARPGATTDEIKIYHPDRAAGDKMTITAPPGTTLDTVRHDGPSTWEVTYSADKKRAWIAGCFGGACRTVWVKVNVPAEAAPGSSIEGGTAVITDNAGMLRGQGGFSVDVGQRASVLLSPQPGSTIAPETVFTGSGPVGDVVAVMDKAGKTLGSAIVDGNGDWRLTLAAAPDNGPVVLRFVSAQAQGAAFAEPDYTMTGSVNAFKVLSPVLAPNESVKNGTVFAGVGHPGSAVAITDKDGTVVGETVVDEDGNWSTSITGLAEGPNRLTATATLDGHDPWVIDLGPVVIVGDDPEEPVMDPALAGGAALALLAAAGTVIAVRRRVGQR